MARDCPGRRKRLKKVVEMFHRKRSPFTSAGVGTSVFKAPLKISILRGSSENLSPWFVFMAREFLKGWSSK